MLIGPVAMVAGIIKGIIQIMSGDWEMGLGTMWDAYKSIQSISSVYGYV